jgi:hypothetical protein
MKWLKSYKENNKPDYEVTWGIDPDTLHDIFIEFQDIGCEVKTNFKQKFKQWLFGDVDVTPEKDSPLSLHLVTVIEVKVFKPEKINSDFTTSTEFKNIVDNISHRLKYFGWKIKEVKSSYDFSTQLQSSGTLVEFSLNKINI